MYQHVFEAAFSGKQAIISLNFIFFEFWNYLLFPSTYLRKTIIFCCIYKGITQSLSVYDGACFYTYTTMTMHRYFHTHTHIYTSAHNTHTHTSTANIYIIKINQGALFSATNSNKISNQTHKLTSILNPVLVLLLFLLLFKFGWRRNLIKSGDENNCPFSSPN